MSAPSSNDLDALLAELHAVVDEVGERAATAASAILGGSRDLAAMQLAETASDVVAMGRVLEHSAADADRASRAETARVLAAMSAIGIDSEFTFASQPIELERFRVAVKAWFFFVRALCDNAYRLLLAQAQSGPAPASGSMSKAAGNPNNEVAKMLAERAPDFLPWFVAFRDKRDEIKTGVNFAITGLGGPGVGVVFTRFTAARGVEVDLSGQRTVTTIDLLESAKRMVELLSLLDTE
jgi:hypothetical protein